MKKMILADSAGFCFGVNRSVDMAEKLIGEYGACASLGELIHNEDVVNALIRKGMCVVHSPEECASGEHVLIRAHGAPPEVYEELKRVGAYIHDATCPKVRAIHKIVSAAREEGRFTIVIGMRDHPEVLAICGWCGEHAVFDNAQELEKWLSSDQASWEKPITVVVQTTQTHSNFTECCDPFSFLEAIE